MSLEPFNRLVKLAARAFYDDLTFKGENQPKTGRSDNRGIAVVVLDALTRRQWVREEDLGKDLKLHGKQLRRILHYFENEKLITSEQRKETAKGAKIFSAAVAATGDGHNSKEGEEKVKLHTHLYCCLDYSQIYDVVRFKINRMRKKLKDELDNKNTVQEYICPNCNRRYTALDALQLISSDDEFFHCENCNGELVAESDKLAAQEAGDGDGDGDDNARRRRREKLKSMLQKMEEQLKPLMDQLTRIKDLPVPEFGNLQAWEAHAHAARRGLMGDGSIDPSKSSQNGYGATPMPFLGDTKVEVAFSGLDDKQDVNSETAGTSLKVLPPWMIKEGMKLTKEQRGEVKEEVKMDGTSTSFAFSDDKKSSVETDDKKSIQDEYIKAYYAALLKQQQELEEAAKKQQELSNQTAVDGEIETSSTRQVGMKSKREDGEGDDEVEWEESSASGQISKHYKVDLNEQAEASEENEDEDDIDWEEG